MKVLLKRAMYIGDIYYEPNPAGTIIPDKIGDRTVELYDHKNPPKSRQDQKILFEVSADQQTMTRHIPDSAKIEPEAEEDKKRFVLPRDVVEWSDEAAKDWVPQHIPLIKGHPELGTQIPLSALTPGLSKAETEAAVKAGLTQTLADRAEKERQLLDPDIVGVASLGPGNDAHSGQSASTGKADVRSASDKAAADRKAAADKAEADRKAANVKV